MTGLLNRRAFFDRAQMAFRQPPEDAADTHRLALVMFDIDHFKRVNDLHGHTAGDQVLKEVAHRAKSILRDGDLLARYGGEEFIVLLTATRKEDARTAADRLRAVISAQGVQVDDHAISVSISVGLAFQADGTETLQQTIERADACLYRAKREGRNCVVDDEN